MLIETKKQKTLAYVCITNNLSKQHNAINTHKITYRIVYHLNCSKDNSISDKTVAMNEDLSKKSGLNSTSQKAQL